MPGDMNGLELAQEIDRRFPGTPITLTTGYSGPVDRQPLSGSAKIVSAEEFERLLASVLAPIAGSA